MNRILALRPTTAVVVAFGAALLVSRAAGGEPPSNLRLIAAMPPGAESVLLFRLDRLTEPNSVLRDWTRQYVDNLGQTLDPNAQNEPLNVIERGLSAAKPLVHAEGGSDFMAEGIGVGNYNGREIWVTEKPLTALVTRLTAKQDVQGELTPFKLGTVSAFECPCLASSAEGDPNAKPLLERRFVAFPDERTFVLAESREELEAMLHGLVADRPKLPDRWARLGAQLGLESPIVLIRWYDPNNTRDYFSPVNPKHPRTSQSVDIDGVALVCPSVNRFALRMTCISRQPEQALAFFQEFAFKPAMYNWDTKMAARGFYADITITDEKHAREYLPLLLYVLFGPNVII